MMWAAVIAAAGGCYLLKVLGLSIPQRVLGRPAVRSVAALMPVALLAALVATGTFANGMSLTVDDQPRPDHRRRRLVACCLARLCPAGLD